MTDEPRQPTLDELRAAVGSQAARPPGRRGLYAAEPGTGPTGKTCHDCGWLTYTGHGRRCRYPKCGKTAYTSGDATTIKTRTPACHHFEPDPQVPLKYRPSPDQNSYRQYHKTPTVAPTP